MPGVSVEVTVGGTPLKEYQDRDYEEPSRTTPRFVEAVTGQMFAVSIKLQPGFSFKGDRLARKVLVDGKLMQRPLMTKTQMSTVVEGAYFADGRMRAGELQGLKELGTIKVECSHRNVGKATTFTPFQELSTGIVCEKALKGQGITHSVDLSAATKVSKCTYAHSSLVKGEHDPGATFVFAYRSFDALKSMLIIPRTPTPPPLEEKNFDDLTRDELRELHRRAQEKRREEESKVKIKREQSEDDPRPRKKARATQGNTQLELGDDGPFRDRWVTLPRGEQEVIELD